MEIPLYQVDAFTDRPFAGNPAAVCPLDAWLPDATLQAIAAENNLSETAFFVPEGEDYVLRWFTPTTEVDLCGHATLASAFVVLEELTPGAGEVRFHSPRSGPLTVARDGAYLSMDFPSRPPNPVEARPEVAAALGHPDRAAPIGMAANADTIVVEYARQADVAALRPDFAAVLALDRYVIATAAGSAPIDFVSRFFAPNAGVDEDPVTGSAHCVLVPYWAERVGAERVGASLRARQISARGGDLWCALRGARVQLKGQAVLVLRGQLVLPDG